MAQSIIRALGYTGGRQILTWPLSQAYNGTVTAYLWGGGGGGGGNDASNPGGKGSGGGFTRVTIDVNPGDVLEVSVGGGGGAGQSPEIFYRYYRRWWWWGWHWWDSNYYDDRYYYWGSWGWARGWVWWGYYGGSPGGTPGASLLLGGGIFNTANTGLPRVQNSAYCTFLNNTGVWNEPGGGSEIFDRSFTVNFPSTGVYTFEASVDNYGYVYVDGVNVLNAWTFTTSYVARVNVTSGNHTVRLYGVNTGGPGSFGLTINGGSSFCGGEGGRAGWTGSSGGGGGGGGATVLRKNGIIVAVAGGGGGAGGAGISSGTEPGNAPGPFGQSPSSITIGSDGEDRNGDGGGGGGGGGGWGAGNGGAQAPYDTWGYAGFYGGNRGDVSANPSGRVPGGVNQTYYPGGGVGYGGDTTQAGNPGYAVLDFEINGTFVKVDNTWQNVKQTWVKDQGTWYPVKGDFINVNGTWEPVSGTYAPNFEAASGQFGYVSREFGISTILVACVAVIDECSVSASTIQADWNRFTSSYPQRTFNLLQPGGPTQGDLKVPGNFYDFTGARGPIPVIRDNGGSEVSDWFGICGLDAAPAGSKVILAVDNSGSMTTDTVRSSYNLFLAKCAAGGITVTQVSMGSGGGRFGGGNENWVTPFIINV